MKIKSIVTLTAALACGAIIVIAQDNPQPLGERPGVGPGNGGPGRRGPGPRGPAIIAALDANKDAKLDATEIANAPAALKTLDANGDGELSTEEMFGPRGGGPNGGPGRFGPPPHEQQQ